MKTRRIFFGMLALLSLAFSSRADSTEKKKISAVPGTAVLLPLKGVTFHWVLPPALQPGETTKFKKASVFSVDSSGRPWLGDGKTGVTNPLQKMLFFLDLPYEDFTFSGAGDLIFFSKGTLGMAVPGKSPRFTKQNYPLLALNPLVKVPLQHARLFPAPHGLYLAGKAASGKHELFYLDAVEGSKAGLRKLLSSDKEITAVAGDGVETFAAMGKLVLRVNGGKTLKMSGILEHPKAAVTGLAYDKGSGLFYATSLGCGYIDLERKKHLDFLFASDPKLFLTGGSLYIYISQVQGVERLSGIKQFKKIFNSSH